MINGLKNVNLFVWPKEMPVSVVVRFVRRLKPNFQPFHTQTSCLSSARPAHVRSEFRQCCILTSRQSFQIGEIPRGNFMSLTICFFILVHYLLAFVSVSLFWFGYFGQNCWFYLRFYHSYCAFGQIPF